MNLSLHNVLGDERGNLVAIEGNRDLPFEIKRIFYIYGAQQDLSRGNHAHFETKQYLISVSGSCKVTLDDGKGNTETYLLDSPNKGLFQDALVWGVMHDFSRDNVLLVMADEYYVPADYINDYNEFLKIVNG